MFLFRKKKQVRVKVISLANGGYDARATDGEGTVYNCYGSTKEAADAIARLKLRQFKEYLKERDPNNKVDFNFT